MNNTTKQDAIPLVRAWSVRKSYATSDCGGVEVIAQALHDITCSEDLWPCRSAEHYRERARLIVDALDAPCRTITREQIKPGMRVRVSDTYRGVLRERTLTVENIQAASPNGVWISARPSGEVWVANDATIVWLGGTEPEPIDPDAEVKEAVISACYKTTNALAHAYSGQFVDALRADGWDITRRADA